MKNVSIRGYTDAPSVAPGESISFCVSSDHPGQYDAQLVRLIHGDTHPDGPGYKEEVVESEVDGTYAARKQRVDNGGYVEVDHDPQLTPDSLSVHAFIWPTTPTRGRQGVIGSWDDSRQRGWALTIEDGRLSFLIGDGSGTVNRATIDIGLFEEVWYSVVATYDAGSGEMSISQTSVINRTNSRYGVAAALDTDSRATASASASGPLVDSECPLLIAALCETTRDTAGRIWSTANFNGKIDSPKVYAAVLDATDAAVLASGGRVSQRPVAQWDFADGIGANGIPTDRVTDVGVHGLHGTCRNQPDRGMTGWNWEGLEENFVHCPEQYGAIWFHEDSLDDCRWDVDAVLSVPASLRSGFYALRVTQGDDEDYIPFIVRPPRDRATAPILLVASTFSYLAYANEQIMHKADIGQAVAGHTPVLNQRDVELHKHMGDYGLSTYDGHVDGRGVQYTTWRRPILNLRPQHRQGFGSLWELPADLHLVDWLVSQGYEFDVAAEHDLNDEGVDLLSRYTVVMTGSHPEYQTVRNCDAWEDYLAGGGRGMYLGGNGMYWIVSVHPEKPWVMEVRKELGVTAWAAPPGESHHSTTGERGGRFRRRARPPQKVWGTGMSSYGFDHSGYFVQMPDAATPDGAWILEGIDPDERIGDFGLVGGGAGGYELDRYDRALGTPPNTVIVASSVEHSVVYTVVPEDKAFPHPGMNGGEHPLVRADMTYFSTTNGGGMFASSTISWCGSLSWNGYDNNVSRIMNNVLGQFLKDEPAPVVA